MTNAEVTAAGYSYRTMNVGRYWTYSVSHGDTRMPTAARGYRTEREAAAAARRSIKRYTTKA